MKTRRIVLTIDSIIEIFKDYLSTQDIPQNVVPLKLMVNPSEQRRLAILCESLDWKPGLPPMQVHFDLKRIYTVS